jgi:nitroreductase
VPGREEDGEVRRAEEEEPAVETWDAIRARRNVRSYRPDPVPKEALNRIAEAGWRAPSASNRQHWDFVVVTDRDQLQALSTVWQGARHIAQAAAAIALVIPQAEDERTKLIDYFDLGQAIMAMELAAADLGIGTGHASVGDQERAREILSVPGDHDVAFMLGVGYPADRPLRPIAIPNRRPISDVVRYGHW